MKVAYKLEMNDLIVHREKFDQVVIEWEDDATSGEVDEYWEKWIATPNFLTSRINNLDEVGESTLTIESADAATF